MRVVDIETEVEHGCLLKSMELGTAATGFRVIRLTEASFIVSTLSYRSIARARGTLTSYPLNPTTSGYSVLQVVDGQTRFADSTSIVRVATRSNDTAEPWQDFPTFADLFGSANVASGF
jgi:hypothetical protein